MLIKNKQIQVLREKKIKITKEYWTPMGKWPKMCIAGGLERRENVAK